MDIDTSLGIISKDVQQRAEHAGAAEGEEGLRPEGERHLHDALDKQGDTQDFSRGQEGETGAGETVNAQCNEDDTDNAEPDFFTGLHFN